MTGGEERFIWGVATSSYQIEGYPLADGGGACIWHEFSHTPGNVTGNDNGDVACDHYHRYEEDVELMRRLGVGGYRFSVRWPRIIPSGTGPINEHGLDFYDRLVDRLLQHGIRPFLTLYHWDLPTRLQDRGGWTNPDMPGWFADYARVVVRRLGDRVHHVLTLNEPWVTAFEARVNVSYAPGMRNVFSGMRAVRQQIRAHLTAYDAIKSENRRVAVGICLSNTWWRPERPDDEEDCRAARVAFAFDAFPLFLDPLLRGNFPPELDEYLARYLPDPQFSRLGPGRGRALDYVGLNYYSAAYAAPQPQEPFGFGAVAHPERPHTGERWMIDPGGVYELLLALKDRYGDVPVYITENGLATEDPSTEAAVHDPERIAFLSGHIANVLAARDRGVDVRGYFLWSLLDNFEWSDGFTRRFGIVHVDRDTLRRTIKDSGRWYARVCRGEVVPVIA